MSSSSKKERVGVSKPPSGNKGSSTPTMKESKSENSSLGVASIKQEALLGKATKSPMSKAHYLSKSHENLTSHQKQKYAALHTRPKSSLGLPDMKKKTSSNKENIHNKGKDPFLKPKPFKGSGTSTPKIRKASSSQHIDSAGTNQGGHQTPQKVNKTNMKKAQSTQNVSKDSAVKKRTSAASDVMAYNAELLANFEKEKRNQEAKISELIQLAESRKVDIEKHKYEIKKLKDQIPGHDVTEENKILRSENTTLREQLMKLGFPVDQQITDAEKLSLKNQSHADGEMKTSASYDSLSTDGHAVSMTPMQMLGGGMKRSASITMSEPGISFTDYSTTPEQPTLLGKWDSRSKSSDALSDISVANLTERIMQMEETHYSTNEELQATLQELGDLQDAVNELTEENERLADERSVLLESLCTQTEKLEHCRTQIEQLKCLLISGDLPNKSDRDQHLLGLLKGAQEERDEMVRKQVEFQNALYASEVEYKDCQDQADSLKDKVQHLEDKISGLKTEKEKLEKQAGDLKESLENEYIEVAHYKTLLDNEKSKVLELETVCKAAQQSDLEEMLHNALKEKDKLEDRLANVQDALAHSQKEVSKLKDQIISKEEETKVSKNNAKSQLIDMEYTIQSVKKDRYDCQQENENLREQIEQLEQDSDRYFEERKKYITQIKELQGEINAMRQLKECVEDELHDTKVKHEQEVEEWKQFQQDLQVAVRIANDFKSESQTDVDVLKADNSSLKDKCHMLQSEIDRLKCEIDAYKIQERSHLMNSRNSSSILSSAELKGKVMNTVDKELLHLRGEGKRAADKSQTLSVKNLIRSIEDQVKSGCSSIHSSSCSSRRNSDSETSLVGLKEFHDLMQSPSSPVTDQNMGSPETSTTPLRSVLKRSAERPCRLQRHSMGGKGHYDSPSSPGGETPKSAPPTRTDAPTAFPSILSARGPRRSSGVSALDQVTGERKEVSAKDPLSGLAKSFKGSKRNALLKWCQQKTITYSNVDITNFSSSWNDGLAFCALLHSFMPDKIPYGELTSDDKRRNFTLGFNAADSAGISSTLNINDMVAMERPDWQAVFTYVTAIYKHFEVDNKT